MTRTRLYRALLVVLPARRRQADGAEMTAVFERLYAETRQRRGVLGVIWLWMRETGGVLRFAAREWRSRLAWRLQFLRATGPSPSTELKWAVRGLRARGWAGLMAALLLAVVVAVNALVFAVTDSLVFRPVPYPAVERLVKIAHQTQPPDRLPTDRGAPLDAWRKETQVFSAVGGYLSKTVFLMGGTLEEFPTVDLSVGTLDVLGVTPDWGRDFTVDDLRDSGSLPALISARLAARRFGSPERALGQRLEASGLPLIVIGVMSDGFAFPSPNVQVWRGIDPAGPMTRNFGGMFAIGRLADHVDPANAQSVVEAAATRVGGRLGAPSYSAKVTPYASPRNATERQRLLLVLTGAAVCLLLVACANIASIELAYALKRTRVFALQASLGASRWMLCRLVALEGAMFVGVSAVAGLLAAHLLIPAIREQLPVSMRVTENVIDIDARVVIVSAVAACLAWAVSVLPSVIASSRLSLTSLLALDTHAATASRRSLRLRQLLIAGQVATSVVLVIGGLLYVRSYLKLLEIETGFDTRGVATVSINLPGNTFANIAGRLAFQARLQDEIRRVPGVIAASGSDAPPSVGDSPMRVQLEIDGRPAEPQAVLLGRKWIDLDYFATTQLALVEGRYPAAGDSPTDVVVPDTFARRFWPDGHAIGATFRDPADGSWFKPLHRVVGVVRDFRRSPRRLPDITDQAFYIYAVMQPQAYVQYGPEPELADNGGMYSVVSVLVRMRSPEMLPAVLDAAHRVDPRTAPTGMLADDEYAKQHAEILLASRVMNAFGVVALLTAMVGLYGVVAFLVAARTREIGVRVALGATWRDIRRMVLSGSGWAVASGVLAGCLIAASASTWIESQLYGVSRLDLTTYGTVLVAVGVTAVLAAWGPARHASRIDPAITLRTE